MEILEIIWNYALPIGTGVTVGGIIAFFAVTLLRGLINKTAAKIDVEKIEQKAIENGIEKIKTVSFKQSIEPLVKSEMLKVVETVNKEMVEKLSVVDEDYTRIIDCFEKFAAYFDNSIGVSDEKKQNLKDAISGAKKAVESAQEVEAVFTATETEKVAENREIKPTMQR